VSGSGDVSVDGVRGDVFRTEVSGAGNVQASGQVDRVEAVVSQVMSIGRSCLRGRQLLRSQVPVTSTSTQPSRSPHL
jgi:Putative auto-transporter adhesin, head GIN domain